MKTKQRFAGYEKVIEANICGIPCLAAVINFTSVKGSFSHNAPSDVDYYGYEEIDYVILDRRGYRARWLERKIENDDSAIRDLISKNMNED